MEDLWVEEKRRTKRGIVSFTQYLESQENQDMTRLLNFTRIQERKREGVSVSWNGGEGGVYIVVMEKI